MFLIITPKVIPKWSVRKDIKDIKSLVPLNLIPLASPALKNFNLKIKIKN